MAAAVGKTDPLGEHRIGDDKGNPLAGKSTLKRLETTNAKPTPGAPGLPRDVGDPPGGSLPPAVLNAVFL